MAAEPAADRIELPAAEAAPTVAGADEFEQKPHATAFMTPAVTPAEPTPREAEPDETSKPHAAAAPSETPAPMRHGPTIEDLDDIDWLMPAEPDPEPEPDPDPEPEEAPKHYNDPRQLSLF